MEPDRPRHLRRLYLRTFTLSLVCLYLPGLYFASGVFGKGLTTAIVIAIYPGFGFLVGSELSAHLSSSLFPFALVISLLALLAGTLLAAYGRIAAIVTAFLLIALSIWSGSHIVVK